MENEIWQFNQTAGGARGGERTFTPTTKGTYMIIARILMLKAQKHETNQNYYCTEEKTNMP